MSLLALVQKPGYQELLRLLLIDGPSASASRGLYTGRTARGRTHPLISVNRWGRSRIRRIWRFGIELSIIGGLAWVLGSMYALAAVRVRVRV